MDYISRRFRLRKCGIGRILRSPRQPPPPFATFWTSRRPREMSHFWPIEAPIPPQMRHMSHFRKRKRRLTDPGREEWCAFRRDHKDEVGRETNNPVRVSLRLFFPGINQAPFFARANRVVSSEGGHFSKHTRTGSDRPGYHPSIVFASFQEVLFYEEIPFLTRKSVNFVSQKGVDTKNALPSVKVFCFLLNLQNFPLLRKFERVPA